MRKMLVGLAVLGAVTVASLQAGAQEEVPGDLNKMATDGYIQVVFHGAAFSEAGSGSTFSGAVLDPSGLQAPLALLPDGRPQLHVTVFTTDWLGDMEGRHFATTGGGHAGLDSALPSAVATSETGYEFTLPADFGGSPAWVSVWAAVQGYPETCGTPLEPAQPNCDGGALGFYNTVKHKVAVDALDVIPSVAILP